jgi:hypothetical protein
MTGSTTAGSNISAADTARPAPARSPLFAAATSQESRMKRAGWRVEARAFTLLRGARAQRGSITSRRSSVISRIVQRMPSRPWPDRFAPP